MGLAAVRFGALFLGLAESGPEVEDRLGERDKTLDWAMEYTRVVLSLVVEAGSLKGRLTDLRYYWICLFLTGD